MTSIEVRQSESARRYQQDWVAKGWTDPASDKWQTDEFGGLLVEANLGQLELERVTELQANVRRLIIASVGYSATEDGGSELETVETPSSDLRALDLGVHRSTFIMPATDQQNVSEYIARMLRERMPLQSGSPTTLFAGNLPSPSRTPGLRFISRDRAAREALTISSSITVNPWQEVISYSLSGIGVGASVLFAIAKGARYMPGLLDLCVRLSTINLEREVQREELINRRDELQAENSIRSAETRNILKELDDDLIEQLVERSTPAANRLLSALVAVGPDAALVATRPLDRQEVAQFRTQAQQAITDPPSA
ncbi:hypothetical protein [Nocardia testacea]|uniref:hypothetical protein n=1 Tax=Nocardia testacea TaxID=248551 RepID=UPI003A88EE09